MTFDTSRAVSTTLWTLTMSTSASTTTPPQPSPRPRHPLGLPAGSIRALLTLMTVGFIVAQTVRGQPIGLLWSEALMIVLAHYFAYRRFVPLSPAVREQLKAAGLIDDELQPLYLPQHSLRIVIVLAFVGLGVFLYREQRLFEPAAIAVLGSVGAYFLGIAFNAVAALWRRRHPGPRSMFWDDLKALVTLLAMTAAITVQVAGWLPLIPFGEKLEALPLALMLFYFGSR